MKKTGFTLLLVFLLIFLNVFQMFGTIATFAYDAINGQPPFDSPEYDAWKQRHVSEDDYSFLNGTSVFAASLSENSLYNDYIEVAVANNARYTVGTTGGNPEVSTDDYKKLLYGHASPRTSYTTIRINGSNYIYGYGTFTISPTFDAQTNKNTSEQKIGNLRIKQILSLVKNTATKREDIVEVKYIVKNEGTASTNTGVRIMMDTMLGNNDAAPFRIPGIGAVTYEREYSGSEVPQYWQAFDSLTNPQVVSQGTLLRSSANKPDKVQFTNWGRVYDNAWGYTVNTSYSNGDSAVSVIWEEKEIAVGQELEYTTHYGLSELVQDLRPPLAVSLFGDASVSATESGYEPNPFVVTTYIQNTGTASASNVMARINLPDGLRLSTYEAATKEIGSFSVNQEKQLSWAIEIEPGYSDITQEYSVDVWADGVENKNVRKSIIIPKSLYLRKTGNFKYTSTSSSDRDFESTYYYDDKYFIYNSYVYNESLATMSLCLAMAAGGSNEKTYFYKSDNAKDLLTQTGFSQFDTNNWFKVKPTADSIGVVAANKKIVTNKKQYTLIAVGVRGFGYEQEWASNFTLGRTGQHHGFNEAKNNVLSFIKEYIAKNNISGDIKLWITGFSRAGGTSNLVAGAIDGGEDLGNCSLDLADLYTYTFEAPMGAVAVDATTNPVYNNIFNIVNPSDPVPKVAPGIFKFRRYGIDKTLPSAQNDNDYINKKDDMLCIYDPMESTVEPYSVDNFIMKKITVEFVYQFPVGVTVVPTIANDANNHDSQSAFLNNFISRLAKERFKSRANYVDTFQDGIREVFKVLNGTTDEIDGKQDVKWAKFKEIFLDKLKSNIGTLVASTTPVGSKIVGSTSELVEKYAVESLNEAGITSFSKDQIIDFALTITKTVFSFAVSHPNLTATMVLNIKGIGSAHYPELCLAWMQSMDKNYTTDAGQAFSYGSYRTIRINCPVDVEVYDLSGILVAAIKSDAPQIVEGSSIISSINEDGEKLIYLPATSEYNLKLIPTGSGHMTYSVNEFDSVVGDVNRLVNYYDISINPGDVFTSNIPAYSDTDIANGTENGSTTIYSLLDYKNELIAASDDLKGTDATEAYYMVNVTSSNEEYGYVTGQGIRQLGNYAQISATPFNDCEFDGWYINDKKISSDTQYRFCVKSDVEIIAKFTNNKPPVANAGPNQTIEATSPNGANVILDGTASSDPDGDTLMYSWTGSFGTASGSNPTIQLPLGENKITLTVSDGKATSSAEVIIKIVDTTLPMLTLPADKKVVAAGAHTPVNIGTATAADIFGVTVTNDAPDLFPLGTTNVTWTATDANGNISSGIQKVTVSGDPVLTGKLKVETLNANISPDANMIYPRFKVTNTSNAAINLSDIRLRYYYTIDQQTKQNFWCDWSTIGASKVTGKFIEMDEKYSNANTILEIGFKSDSGYINPGQTIEMYLRFARTDYTNYNQLNDFSFTKNPCYSQWYRIGAFVGDTLEYGQVPNGTN